MTEFAEKPSEQKSTVDETKTSDDSVGKATSDRVVDPLDLVSTSSFDRDPQEILGNPAVTPEMLGGDDDLRDDLRGGD